MAAHEAEADGRVPVTVVTGYLGAGKTTLVNHILAGGHGRKYAVIVNEYGEIGIDGALIESGEEELIELASGCVCCVVRGDLIRTLRGLLRRSQDLDGILIETTGLADPGPVIQTFFADQTLLAQCRLDSVTTVVDAVNAGDRLADSGDAAEQIALADQILLNKAGEDGADPESLEAALRRLNPFAPIHRTERCRIDPGTLLDRRGFDLDRIAARLGAAPDGDGHDDAGHDHIAEDGIGSVSVECDRPLDASRLESWLQDLLASRGQDILRTKGVIDVAGEQRKLVVQGVNMMLEGDFAGLWEPGSGRRSRLVFIGRNLDADALRHGVRSCTAETAN